MTTPFHDALREADKLLDALTAAGMQDLSPRERAAFATTFAGVELLRGSISILANGPENKQRETNPTT